MNKKIKIGLVLVILVFVGMVFAGMFKFNYLSGLEGYDVDGNKIENKNIVEVDGFIFNLDTKE
jgi:very-short-patch-repair endonuclease